MSVRHHRLVSLRPELGLSHKAIVPEQSLEGLEKILPVFRHRENLILRHGFLAHSGIRERENLIAMKRRRPLGRFGRRRRREPGNHLGVAGIEILSVPNVGVERQPVQPINRSLIGAIGSVGIRHENSDFPAIGNDAIGAGQGQRRRCRGPSGKRNDGLAGGSRIADFDGQPTLFGGRTRETEAVRANVVVGSGTGNEDGRQ